MRDPLIREIRAAFPARRPPSLPIVDGPIGSGPSWDIHAPARVAAAFRDATDWTTFESAFLDRALEGLASALSFFSPEAARFYLPAYMTADLRDGLDRVTPDFHLSHGFTPEFRDRPIGDLSGGRTWTEDALERWAPLTPAPAVAITRYLEWRVARWGTAWGEDATEALRTYWRPRAKAG